MKTCIALILYLFSFTLSASDLPTIKVGMVYFYPPFVMSAGTGFDTQLLQLICHRLKVHCEILPMSFNELYSALDNGKIDVAIGGITVAANWSPNYTYSLPYLLSKGSFMIRNSSPMTSITELNESSIGIIRGSRDGDVFYTYLKLLDTPDLKIKEYNKTEDLVTALSDGDISAAFTHESTVHYWVLNGGNQFKTLGKSKLVGDGIGIMSTPSHAALLNKINQQILQLEQTDAYTNLYQTYFGAEK